MVRVIPQDNGLWRIEGVRQRYFTAQAAYRAAAQLELTPAQHPQSQRALTSLTT